MVDLQRVRPVEYEKEDLHEAMEPFAGHLAALVIQWEGRLRLRSSASSPVDPLVDNHPEIDFFVGVNAFHSCAAAVAAAATIVTSTAFTTSRPAIPRSLTSNLGNTARLRIVTVYPENRKRPSSA